MDSSSGKSTFKRLAICSRAPRCRPRPILAMRLAPALAHHDRRADLATLGCAHGAGQPVLDVVTKPVVLDELRHLGPPGATLGVPLRDRRLVLELPGPSRRVPAQLTRDRRRAPVHTTGDLSHA